jgi:outer membrane protein assembly factor BamD (BamD/ComL family)
MMNVRYLTLLMIALLLVTTSCSKKKKEAEFSEQGMYERALEYFQKSEKYKGNFKFIPASREFLDSLDEAETSINEYLFMYPDGEHAPAVIYMSARLFDVGMRQQFDVALNKYEDLVEKFPRSSEAASARERAEFIRSMFESKGKSPDGPE